MFKIVTTAAVAALLTTSAMAKAPVAKLTGGQFVGATQYTGLVDPSGLCGSLAGLAVGQLTSSVATVGPLGTPTVPALPWTSTIANSNPSPTAAYGVGWINCTFPALGLASSYVATAVGTETEFVSTPVGTQTTSCFASNGTPYVLGSGNGTLGNGLMQTNTVTILPLNGTGKDSSFRVTTTNTSLTVGTNTLCFLSTDAVYSNASK
jgi:hypothetical protein